MGKRDSTEEVDVDYLLERIGSIKLEGIKTSIGTWNGSVRVPPISIESMKERFYEFRKRYRGFLEDLDSMGDCCEEGVVELDDEINEFVEFVNPICGDRKRRRKKGMKNGIKRI